MPIRISDGRFLLIPESSRLLFSIMGEIPDKKKYFMKESGGLSFHCDAKPERIMIVYKCDISDGKIPEPDDVEQLETRGCYVQYSIGGESRAFGNVPHEWMCVPSIREDDCNYSYVNNNRANYIDVDNSQTIQNVEWNTSVYGS